MFLFFVMIIYDYLFFEFVCVIDVCKLFLNCYDCVKPCSFVLSFFVLPWITFLSSCS